MYKETKNECYFNPSGLLLAYSKTARTSKTTLVYMMVFGKVGVYSFVYNGLFLSNLS